MRDPMRRRYFHLMLAIFGAIALSIILFFLLFRMQGVGAAIRSFSAVLAPFIYGGVIAYLLRPMCNSSQIFLEKHLPGKTKKAAPGLAVFVSILTGIFVVYALITMIVPPAIGSIVTLWNAIPGSVQKFLTWARDTFGENEELLEIFNNGYNAIYTTLDNWVQNTLMPQITNIVSGVGLSVWRILIFIYNVLIGLIVSVYLLYGRKKFARQCVLIVRSVLPQKWADALLNEIAFVDRMFGGFIDGKLLDSAIIGVLCYIGCSILRIPNALLVSVIVGVTNVIPYFGPFIGAIPSALLILISSPVKMLWFVIFILVLQQIDGNIIGPKILGNRTGLSGFWVLLSIIMFGSMWGLAGMLICVPLFAVIYDLATKLVCRGLQKKGEYQLWEKYRADYPDEAEITELPREKPEKKQKKEEKEEENQPE